MSKKGTIRILNTTISAVAGIVLIYFLVRLVNLEEALDRIALFGWREFSLLFVIAQGYLFISTLRWWAIIRAEVGRVPVSFWKLYVIYVAGWPIDYILPTMGLSGQVSRGYLSRRFKLPKDVHVSSLTTEYAIRGLSHAVALPIGLVLLTVYGLPQAGAYVWVGVVVLVVLGFGSALAWFKSPERFVKYKVIIKQGFKRSPGWMIAAFATMGLAYVFSIFQIIVYAGFLAIDLSFIQGLLYHLVTSLALAIPAPLSLGITEASGVLSFSLLDLSAAHGLAMGLLFRINDVVLGILGALFLLLFRFFNKNKRV